MVLKGCYEHIDEFHPSREQFLRQENPQTIGHYSTLAEIASLDNPDAERKALAECHFEDV